MAADLDTAQLAGIEAGTRATIVVEGVKARGTHASLQKNGEPLKAVAGN